LSLPLHAIAMEWYCRRMASVCLSDVIRRQDRSTAIAWSGKKNRNTKLRKTSEKL